jgi:hypothetical protein
MKNLSKPIVLIAIIAIAMTASRKLKAQPRNVVNFQVFYNELNPYGSWIEYPEYGFVWSPNVNSGFKPYSSNGYWVTTEYGNTWVSDYSWGWAPFHYGRWMFDNYYGWLWVPGNEWAPAWVAWRSGGGYYGWAPLTPEIKISVSFNHSIPNNYWVFVPQQYICGPGLSNYYVQHNHVVNIINNTTIISNVHQGNRYYTGPSMRELEKIRGRAIDMYAINSSNRPGRTVVNNRSVNLYRPQIEHDNRQHDRPEHFTRYDDRGNSRANDHYNRDRFENQQSGRQNSQDQRNSDQHTQREQRNDRSDQQMQAKERNDKSVQLQHENRSVKKFSDNNQHSIDQHQNQQIKTRNEHAQNIRKQEQRVEVRERNKPANTHQNNLNSKQQSIDQARTNDSRSSRSRSARTRK